MVMKKKVLFIISNLQSGGVSKSMVSLLNAWDREKYDTSLLLCSKEGDVFGQFLPKDIHILYDERIEFASGGVTTLPSVISSKLSVWWKVKLFFGILLRLVLSRLSRAQAGRLIAKLMPAITDDTYDLIVDYGGQQQLYYMVDKLNGKKKVTFFHSDYSKWPYYYSADKQYYPKVDHILTISKVCVEALKHYFPDCSDKISMMENISSPEVIRAQAQVPVDLQLPKKDVVLCSVGHVCYNKGVDLSIEAARLMKEKGINFAWLFVGKILEPELVEKAKQEGLDDCMMFLGIKANPYPYMQMADIYVQPSRFEGKSISLDEAKILCKPIVVTNFSTVNDQFTDQVNASICQMNSEDLADKIIELASSKELRNSYSHYLQRHIVDNSSEAEKLYDFLK